jgi:hypothetical protein
VCTTCILRHAELQIDSMLVRLQPACLALPLLLKPHGL